MLASIQQTQESTGIHLELCLSLNVCFGHLLSGSLTDNAPDIGDSGFIITSNILGTTRDVLIHSTC